MIEHLKGIILHKSLTGVILDVNGVGYGLELPLSTLCEMGEQGTSSSLWVYTRVREDALKLYGFKSQQDKNTFSVLIGINGVGPKVAIAILSTLRAEQLIRAVQADDSQTFEAVPGIGKRTAEKILLELRAKLDQLQLHSEDTWTMKSGAIADLKDSSSSNDQIYSKDLYSALENLGFKKKDIQKALTKVDLSSSMSFESAVRDALFHLTQKASVPDNKEFESLF